jgi:hypothetical protein
METFRVASTRLFDAILSPLLSLNPLLLLSAVSLLTAVLMLIAFRYTSNQGQIRRIKGKIKTHILEIRIFKHEPRLVLGAQGRILAFALVHLRYALAPFLVMLLPLAILLAQVHLRFGYSPLQPGESVVVTVKLAENVPWGESMVDLAVPDGLEIETPALRVEEEREISWRVKAQRYGEFDLTFYLPGREVQKRLIVANGVVKVSTRRVRPGLVDLLLFPGEAPLPTQSGIQFIEVGYHPQAVNVLGWNLHWLVIFCVLSLAGGYVLKGLFGVEL